MKLTIICPTRDRLDCLQRSLEFLALYNIKANYIIVDSSISKSSYSLYRKYSDILQNSEWNIRYISIPCDSGDFFMWSLKMYKALQGIDTEYCVIDSDDDFLDYDFAISSTLMMDRMPCIGAVNGIVQDFSLISMPKHDSMDKRHSISHNNDGLYCSMRYYKHSSSLSSSASERLMTSSAVWPFEAVHRTSILRIILQISVRIGIDSYLGFLFIHRMVLLAIGGYMLDSTRISTFRQDNTPRNSGSQISCKYSSKYQYYSEDAIFTKLSSSFNARAIEKILDTACISVTLPISEIIMSSLCDLYQNLLHELLRGEQASSCPASIPSFDSSFIQNIESIVKMQQG